MLPRKSEALPGFESRLGSPSVRKHLPPASRPAAHLSQPWETRIRGLNGAALSCWNLFKGLSLKLLWGQGEPLWFCFSWPLELGLTSVNAGGSPSVFWAWINQWAYFLCLTVSHLDPDQRVFFTSVVCVKNKLWQFFSLSSIFTQSGSTFYYDNKTAHFLQELQLKVLYIKSIQTII